MSKEKEGKQKTGKTAPSSTPKEKKAAKRTKRNAKNRTEQRGKCHSHPLLMEKGEFEESIICNVGYTKVHFRFCECGEFVLAKVSSIFWMIFQVISTETHPYFRSMDFVVPGMGIEPTHPNGHMALNHACLPVPAPGWILILVFKSIRGQI